jgi:hypothetical protein
MVPAGVQSGQPRRGKIGSIYGWIFKKKLRISIVLVLVLVLVGNRDNGSVPASRRPLTSDPPSALLSSTRNSYI